MLVHQNVSLKPYNTMGIDVMANYLLHVEHREDLVEAFRSDQYKGLQKLIIGGGSNILFTQNQRKAVLKIALGGIDIIKENADFIWVHVGAGVIWHQFVLWCVERGYGGVENLSLIPGTVGAAPMQNIGAYGVEIKQVFDQLTAYEIATGQQVIFTKNQCKFGYRQSIFKQELRDKYVITAVTFKLTKKPEFNISYGAIKETLTNLGIEKLTIKAVSEAVIAIRMSKLPDPAEIGNCGSFFKNPVIDKNHFDALRTVFPSIPGYGEDNGVKVPAGWLIEHAGWKGYREGDIGVHAKQALVLVNYGKGKGSELQALSKKIQHSVQQKFGVELEPEVNII